MAATSSSDHPSEGFSEFLTIISSDDDIDDGPQQQQPNKFSPSHADAAGHDEAYWASKLEEATQAKKENDVTLDTDSGDSPVEQAGDNDVEKAAIGAAAVPITAPVTPADSTAHTNNNTNHGNGRFGNWREINSTKISDLPPWARRLHLVSILLFVLGSILYLVMAVDDYQWANVLLTLPEWLRVADDDLTWANYRIEERYNASVAAAGGATNGGGGGVRRMLKRRKMEEEREELVWRKWEEGESARRARRAAEKAQGTDKNRGTEGKRRELKGRGSNALPRLGKAAKARQMLEAQRLPLPMRNLQTDEEPETPAGPPTPEDLYYETDWILLPDDVRAAYETLGYTEDDWCNGLSPVVEGFPLEEWDWVELEDDMKEAALLIGYTEEIWCAGLCDLYEADLMPSMMPSGSPSTSEPTLSPTPDPTANPTTASPTKRPTPNPVTDSPTGAVQYWDDLTQSRQHDLLVLGFDPNMWNAGAISPVGALDWNELSFGERFAVISLGYTAEGWDGTPAEERFPGQPEPTGDAPVVSVPAPALPSEIRFILGPGWEGDAVPTWAEMTQVMRNRAAFVGFTPGRWDLEVAGDITSLTLPPATAAPSKKPTAKPTANPTMEPTDSPTPKPTTGSPSMQPTAMPETESPTMQPTKQPVTDSPTKSPVAVPPQIPTNPTPEELYYDQDWLDLPPEIREAYILLGYDAAIWEGVGTAYSEDWDWVEFTPEMKEAALLIGYTEEIWCAEGCDEYTKPTPEELYYDSDWLDLPQEIRESYILLGYDEAIWEGVGTAYSEDWDWVEFTPEMKEAALLIGYTEEIWCAEGCDAYEGAGLFIEQPIAPDENPPFVNFPAPSPETPPAHPDKYVDYDWEELPPEVQEAAATLGYDQKLWDMGGYAWSEDYDWDELDAEAQAAAALLGYDKATWDGEESEGGATDDYESLDDDYVFPVAGLDDVWVSRYQILYFFAALCFMFVGMIDLVVEKNYFHVLMILAGFFGVLSSIYVEEDIRTSDILNAVSVHFYLLEAITLFGHHKRTRMGEDAGVWTKRLVLLADIEFAIGAFMDVVLSYYYILDPTSDWDTSLMIAWIFSAVLWLKCSLTYLGVFIYDVTKQRDTASNVY